MLADPRFGLFGQYCPTTIEQGEDEGLIVAQCKFNVQVKGEAGVFSNAPKKQGLYFTNGDVVNVSDETGSNIFSAYAINSVVYVLGHPVTDVGPTDIEEVAIYGLSPAQTSIRWLSRSPLKRIWIGKDVLLNKLSPGEQGLNYFSDVRDTLEGIYFIGRTKAEVKAMVGYPWGLHNGHVLHCTDGDIIIDVETEVQFADGTTNNVLWKGEVTFQMAVDAGLSDTSPSARIVFGTAVSSIADECFVGLPVTEALFKSGLLSIGRRAFAYTGMLTKVELPDTVQSIAEDAFVEDPNIEVTFQGRTKAEVQAMENYGWGLLSGRVIHCTDGDITI